MFDFLLLMNCLEMEHSLDSLWFFSNVLSSRTKQSGKSVNEDKVQEEDEKPRNEIKEETKLNESPCAKSLVPRCPRCGEYVPELQGKSVEVVEGFSKPAEEKRKSSSRRKRRSKRRLFHERRKILGELDLGFDHENMDSEWLFSDEDQTKNMQKNFGNQYNMNTKMPPLNDNMAMKEHLKSWAYAVACTVR